MNNKYICKAKRKDNNEWVTGYYVCLNGNCHRIYIGYAEKDCGDYYPEYCEVIPKTVGQCTGLKDKNGKLIFEGDILRVITGNGWSCPKGTKVYYEVVFTEFNEECATWAEYIGFMAKRGEDNLDSIHYIVNSHGAEVIGNIYDNPESLEVER